jgi:hypothetical protein
VLETLFCVFCDALGVGNVGTINYRQGLVVPLGGFKPETLQNLFFVEGLSELESNRSVSTLVGHGNIIIS